MLKDELKRYLDWFMEMLPGRVKGLVEAVKETPGFETWRADYTPSSLDLLGQWLLAKPTPVAGPKRNFKKFGISDSFQWTLPTRN